MPIVYGPQNALISLIWESGNFASGSGATVFGLELDPLTESTIAAVAAAIPSIWSTHLRPTTDSDYTLASVRYETDTLSGEVVASLAGGGSVTGPPSNTALLCSYFSIFKGRRNRGRNYWPGLLGETQVDERGTIVPARVTSAQNDIDAFFAAIIARPEVVNQCISQSATPGAVTPPIIPWPRVATRVVQPVIGTQRRRVRP